MEKTDKCRLCRRAGEKLFLKGDKCSLPSCPVAKRPYPPGQTGAKGQRRKASDYAKQLLEKQKARAIYRLSEKQMANYFETARKQKLSTGSELLTMLESRADNVVYRAGWASSRSEARQLVAHGNIQVNGKKIQSPSLQTKIGDKFTINTKIKQEGKRAAADWIKMDKSNREFEVINTPDTESVATSINIQLIIEFYSR
jgi:small subunit ribosomal protein S4